MKDEILRLRKRISRLKWGINGSIEYLNKVELKKLNKKGSDVVDTLMLFLTTT